MSEIHVGTLFKEVLSQVRYVGIYNPENPGIPKISFSSKFNKIGTYKINKKKPINKIIGANLIGSKVVIRNFFLSYLPCFLSCGMISINLELLKSL